MLLVSGGWHLADKVYWRVGRVPYGVLIGRRKDRKYLGSCGGMLRFTRDIPVKSWTNPDALNQTDSCWERSFTEDASWYVKQIGFSCPTDGIVLDPCCKDGFVAEAALMSGRQFIGIDKDISVAQNRINDIVQGLC